MDNSTILIARQTLYRLSAATNDANFRLQVALVKLQAMLGTSSPLGDELYAEAGQAIALLRAAMSKLEVFLFTLSEHPSL